MAGLAQNFATHGAPMNQANLQAYSVMARTISAQATTLAYIDIISTGAILVLLLAPLAFLMQRPPKGAAAAAAH